MKEQKIMYRYINSPLGKLIVGATPKGCCLIQFDDSQEIARIKENLEKRYKLRMSKGTNQILDQLESELKQYFNGLLKTFTVPLDIRGTPFQKAVWNQLIIIPYGETKSYSEVAKLLEKPKAARAVGKANGNNYISIVIPCHRVINSNMNLNKYNGGIWRKRKLLSLENNNS